MDDYKVASAVSSTFSAIAQSNQAQSGNGKASKTAVIASFQDLVKEMHLKLVDPGMQALSSTQNVASIKQKSQTPDTDHQDNLSARDSARDTYADRSGDNDYASADPSSTQSDRRDDYGRADGGDRRSDFGAASSNNQDGGDFSDYGQGSSQNQNAGAEGNGQRQGGGNDSDARNVQQGAADQAAGQQGNQQNGKGNAGAGENAANHAALVAQQVENVMANVTVEGSDVDFGTEVALAATANVGDPVAQAARSGEAQQAAQRAANNMLGQAQQQQANQAQANVNPNAAQQTQQNSQTPADSLLAQQANALAKATGGESNILVDVDVTEEQALLNTRSANTLTSGAALAAQSGQSANSQQTNPATQAQVMNPAVAAAQAQAQTPQGVGQAGTGATQATQGQVAQQISAESRGPIQGAANSGGAGAGTHSAGGETTTTNNSNAAAQTQQAQDARDAKEARNAQPQQQTAKNPAVEQVNVQITKALKMGQDKINIRLFPHELGRVEVKLEMGENGRTVAVVTAEKPETLEMLRRDSESLAKALQEAGLDTSSDDLNYNLKGESDGKGQKSLADGAAKSGEQVDGEEEVDGAVMAAHEMGIITNGRIDVRA